MQFVCTTHQPRPVRSLFGLRHAFEVPRRMPLGCAKRSKSEWRSWIATRQVLAPLDGIGGVVFVRPFVRPVRSTRRTSSTRRFVGLFSVRFSQGPSHDRIYTLPFMCTLPVPARESLT